MSRPNFSPPKTWAVDDAVFAREQIDKLVASGEITEELGEELLRMRYADVENNVQGN